jgi:3-phenylpropionate/trans-cinnamate dioxygenase ferredoxin reductase subunit
VSDINRVLILGGGQAGGEAATHLRGAKFQGEITLIGEEPLPPYQRPPLSKKFLAGELPEDRLPLRPVEVYGDENITLMLGRRATWIDRTQKRVRLDGGQELPYDALIIATGSRARPIRLPGVDLPGVHYLRTAADVDAIRPRFKPGAKLAVIGAGYIGLEVAAVARERGLEVTVLEAAARPLSRVTSPEIAGFFLDQHTARGVQFVLGVQAAVIKGETEVRGVGLADGTEVPADLVIIGAGVMPETSLADLAGLEVAKGPPPTDGIVTDTSARTSDPSIYAIGDCARRPMSYFDNRPQRLESVHNAIEGAKIAAAAIAGVPPPSLEIPWFWSDQYDLKLTIAGLFQGYDSIVTRGNMADRAFAVFYYRAGKLLAVDAINRPADYLGAKMAMQRGANLPAEAVADVSRTMKDIVAAAR